MMLDVRTLFVVMIAASLLLAGSMAVAAGMQFRDGVGKWTCALVLQAATCVFFLARGNWPEVVTVLIANAIFALCISLQAAAILEFHGRKLAVWWHVAPPVAIIVLFAVLKDNLVSRAALTAAFGAAMLATGLLLQRLEFRPDRPARFMVMAGFVAGAFALFARATVTLVEPGILRDFTTPTDFQGASFLVALGVILLTSVGFLLMQKERAEEVAQRLAVTDPLTGTFNRRTFLELGAKEIARTRRAKGALSLLMIDLDHFKKVNDQYGHQAGDEALKGVVDALQGSLRREDLLVRYGGEEFCVLLPDVMLDQAAMLAERARSAVERATVDCRGKPLKLTISIGVAMLVRDSAEDIERLVSRADEALYSAKASGRNRVVMYPQNSTIAMLSRSHRKVVGSETIAD